MIGLIVFVNKNMTHWKGDTIDDTYDYPYNFRVVVIVMVVGFTTTYAIRAYHN
jgi:hypothetical protein